MLRIVGVKSIYQRMIDEQLSNGCDGREYFGGLSRFSWGWDSIKNRSTERLDRASVAAFAKYPEMPDIKLSFRESTIALVNVKDRKAGEGSDLRPTPWTNSTTTNH